jgi:hypothetical protein
MFIFTRALHAVLSQEHLGSGTAVPDAGTGLTSLISPQHVPNNMGQASPTHVRSGTFATFTASRLPGYRLRFGGSAVHLPLGSHHDPIKLQPYHG